MRQSTRWTRARWHLLGFARRMEIVFAPALGWLVLLLVIPIAWVIGCLLAVLAVTFYLGTVFYSAVRQELRPLTPNS